MNRDVLNHILFEIDERFIELQQFATWHFKLKDFNDDWEVFKQKETFRWTINDLISYIRALRDILNENDIDSNENDIHTQIYGPNSDIDLWDETANKLFYENSIDIFKKLKDKKNEN